MPGTHTHARAHTHWMQSWECKHTSLWAADCISWIEMLIAVMHECISSCGAGNTFFHTLLIHLLSLSYFFFVLYSSAYFSVCVCVCRQKMCNIIYGNASFKWAVTERPSPDSLLQFEHTLQLKLRLSVTEEEMWALRSVVSNCNKKNGGPKKKRLRAISSLSLIFAQYRSSMCLSCLPRANRPQLDRNLHLGKSEK